MSKAKHTPAPWSANEATITYTQFNITAKDSFIGEVGGGLQSDDEIEANARLIAEAPTLLSELEVSTSIMESVLHLFGESMAMSTKFGLTSQIESNKELLKKIEG